MLHLIAYFWDDLYNLSCPGNRDARVLPIFPKSAAVRRLFPTIPKAEDVLLRPPSLSLRSFAFCLPTSRTGGGREKIPQPSLKRQS